MLSKNILGPVVKVAAPVTVLVLAGAALAACEGPAIEPEATPATAKAEQGTFPSLGHFKASDPTARFERRWLASQIDHHAAAIAMSQPCVERAVHDELRSLCAHIIEEQTAEIADMQAWLEEWYGVEHEPMLMPNDEENVAELAALEGEELEQEFLGDMVQHHMMGSGRADTCTLLAVHKPLVASCETQMMDQAAEADRMETWLREWYLECRTDSDLGDAPDPRRSAARPTRRAPDRSGTLR